MKFNNRSRLSSLAVILFAGLSACGGQPPARVEPAAPKPAEQAPAPVAATTTTGNASVSGVIKFDGVPPKMPVVPMNADPVCVARHKSPVVSEALVLGEGNTMANVFVSITAGLPNKTWPAPSEPVVLTQEGCQYKPHVMALMAGQTLKILNPDGTLHNVHAMPKVNAEFNMAMPKTRTEATQVFDKPEGMFPIKCDVHPWMGGWATVMSHPFFAVTGTDGAYKISGLAPGTYTIEAWHEKLGTQKATITVAAANDALSQDFQFTKPQ